MPRASHSRDDGRRRCPPRAPRSASGRRRTCRRCRSRRRGSARGCSPPSSSAACSSTSRAADSWKPAVPKICDPMWQCRPVKISPGVSRMRATIAGSVREGEAELLVLVGGGQEVVGLGVHAAVHADEHGLGRTARARRSPRGARARSALSITIEPMPTATAFSSSTTLLLLPWKPRRAGSAPAARATASSPPDADVDGEALVGDPAHDLGAQERLAGVVDARLHAVRLDRRAEGGERAARVRAHLVLVDDVQRRAERVAQLRGARPPRSAGRRRRRDRRMPATRPRRAHSHRPAGRSQSGASEVEADNSDQSWKGCFGATAAGRARTQRGCRGSGGLTRRAVPRSLGHGICRARLL